MHHQQQSSQQQKQQDQKIREGTTIPRANDMETDTWI